MTPISAYKTAQPYLRLLLQGKPGSGKSTLACQFPKPYIVDCDMNLAGPLRWLEKNKLPLPYGFDVVCRDANGKQVDRGYCYERMASLITAAVSLPEADRPHTIVIDHATSLSDYFIAEILRKDGKKEMSIPLWGRYLAYWREFVARMSTLPLHFVLIAHEKSEMDAVTQTYKSGLHLPGQTANDLPIWFTDHWATNITTEYGGRHEWGIETMPTESRQLKNSLGLPAKFKFSWATIQAALT